MNQARCHNDDTIVDMEPVGEIPKKFRFNIRVNGRTFCFNLVALLQYIAGHIVNSPNPNDPSMPLNPHTQLPFTSRAMRRLKDQAGAKAMHGVLPPGAYADYHICVSFLDQY